MSRNRDVTRICKENKDEVRRIANMFGPKFKIIDERDNLVIYVIRLQYKDENFGVSLARKIATPGRSATRVECVPIALDTGDIVEDRLPVILTTQAETDALVARIDATHSGSRHTAWEYFDGSQHHPDFDDQCCMQ